MPGDHVECKRGYLGIMSLEHLPNSLVRRAECHQRNIPELAKGISLTSTRLTSVPCRNSRGESSP